MTPYNQFASELIHIRTDRNLTQRQTAARCRMSLAAYSRIEQGECELTLDLLGALSCGLGVGFSKLMGIEPDQVPRFFCYENQIITEDAEEIHTWGIAVCSATNAVLSPSGTFIFYYSNLTTQKDALANLVDLMNRDHLELVHVEDVIEDFLTEIG